MSDNNYPALHPSSNHKAFDLIDVTDEPTELYSGSGFNDHTIDPPDSDRCKLSIRERDNQQALSPGYHDGSIIFSPGDELPAAGSFPSADLGSIAGGEGPDPDSVGTLYDELSSTGLDGRKTDTSNGDLLVVRDITGPRLEMYGPLLCGYETQGGQPVDTSSGGGRARWHLCLEDDVTSGDNPTSGKQVGDGNGETRECVEGSWDAVE